MAIPLHVQSATLDIPAVCSNHCCCNSIGYIYGFGKVKSRKCSHLCDFLPSNNALNSMVNDIKSILNKKMREMNYKWLRMSNIS